MGNEALKWANEIEEKRERMRKAAFDVKGAIERAERAQRDIDEAMERLRRATGPFVSRSE